MPVDRDDFADALSYLFQSMSQKYIVFYGQQVYGEYEAQLPTMDLPDGCYMRNWRGHWHLKDCGYFTEIDSSEVPKEIKTLCLVMGIT